MPQIEEIPWQTLYHAYGTCDQFPDVIRWLASSDPKQRSHARNWIEELLFHQGTHYPANEFAVPFLLQAAANPALPERLRFFEFLCRFLTDRKLPRSPFQRAKQNRKLQKLFQHNFVHDSTHWRDLYHRSVAAAWTCRSLLTEMLQTDPSPAARCWAAFLLAHLANSGLSEGGGWTKEQPASWYSAAAATEILDLLLARARTDSSLEVRVSATFAIGFLRDDPGARAALVELYSLDNPALRLAAAAARHIVEPSVPEEVTACVLHGIVHDLLVGQRAAYKSIFDPESPLAVAYANLGFPLREVDSKSLPESPTTSFAHVPFPQLAAWLNASRNPRLPLARLVEQSLETATPRQRSRAVRFLGSVKLPQPDILPLLERLLKHPDPDVQMAAAISLRRRDPKYPVASIIEVFRQPLQHPSANLRRRAVAGLLSMWTPGKGGPIPAALPWVAEAAERETNHTVQKRICKLFERSAIEDESPSEAYFHAQQITTRWLHDPALRRDALAALGDMHGRAIPEEALEPLIAFLHSDAPGRQYVPGRLARIPSPRVLPVFLEALARERDPEVRQSIGWALQKLPAPARVVDALLRAIQDGTLLIDAAIAQPLVLLATGKSPERLQQVAAIVLEALQSPHTQPTEREKLADAAGSLTVEPEQVADSLMKLALSDPEARVRSAAANALVCSKVPVALLLPRAIRVVEQGDDPAIEGILKLLDCGNTPVMPGLARFLLPSLNHPNYWRRQKTIAALTRMAADDPHVERAVLRRLEDEHSSVRDEATKYSFKCLPHEEIIPPLLKTLREPNPSVYAWWNLKGLGNQRQYRALASTEVLLPIAEHLLTHETGLFAADICEWLKEKGTEVAAIAPCLLALLDTPSPGARLARIEALLAVDPAQIPAALQALEPLLSHELNGVRARAEKLKQQILAGREGAPDRSH